MATEKIYQVSNCCICKRYRFTKVLSLLGQTNFGKDGHVEQDLLLNWPLVYLHSWTLLAQHV